MKCPAPAPHETDRLKTLAEYGLASPARIKSLDRIVDIAAKIFEVPMAAVNIVSNDDTFHVSNKGFAEISGSSRDTSFCGHAILQDGVMVVPDALFDERFHDNPLVLDGIIRFYAGVPIQSSNGHKLGALCVVDSKPLETCDERHLQQLASLAKIVEDELELSRLEQAKNLRPSRLATVAELSPNAVICFDSAGRITDWNAAAESMFGHSAAAIIGRAFDSLLAGLDKERMHIGLRRVLNGGKPDRVGIELTGVRGNGQHFPMEVFWNSWHDGVQLCFGSIVRDLTETHRERNALKYLANYDELTGLPNRHLLLRQLTQFISEQQQVALILIDVVGISDINIALGRASGEKLLRIVADRILAAIPPKSIVGRTGPDQFGAIITDLASIRRAKEIAERMKEAIAYPIKLDSGEDVVVHGWIGIAGSSESDQSGEELVANTELALFRARQGEGVCTFTPALRSEAIARRMYDAELRRAFDEEQFTLFYQPQVAMRDHRLTGAEALIRWHHPARGLLKPPAFLQQIESGELAEPVSNWVLKTACAQLALWQHKTPGLCVSVNLCAAQFRSRTLPEVVMETLAAHQLPPSLLELEIAENIVLNKDLQVLPQLIELRRQGVDISFDDFGTGFASLTLLRDFPVTSIKIDKSFTQAMLESDPDRAIVVSIIGLAHELGLRVVAEGIESEETLEFLTMLKCDKGQGFFFGKPMPADVFRHHYLSKLSLNRQNGDVGMRTGT